MHIKIQTGANLSRILQSTVTIEQAFTELVKNSIQNNATFCSIELYEDKAIITDDGDGFPSIKDESGMNGFERYFVFGNSYSNDNAQIRLGQMGIGGKVANDKLSLENQPHWLIETKNLQNQSLLVEYNPPQDFEFLGDYSPEVKEINPSSIETEKGTKISILSLRGHIQKNGWNLIDIKNELGSFFGDLVLSLKEQGKDFDILLNGESLKFSYKLIGSNIPILKKEFDYEINNEKKTSEVSLRMSLVRDLELLNQSATKEINIISQVKIGPLSLSKNHIFKEAVDTIFKENNVPTVSSSKIYEIFLSLIGFVYCDDLSTVLDSSGMPAKDLSHHSLRDDHPITNPFYKAVYEVIIEWIINYINIHDEDKLSLMNSLAKEISNMLLDSFLDDEDIFSIITDDEGEEMDEIATKKEFRASVEKTMEGMDFSMEEDKEIDNSENEPKPKPKPKCKRYLPYSIVDFVEGERLKMSSQSEANGFRVLINSANPKYKILSKEPTPFLISLHIAECLFREIILYKDPNNTQEAIDSKISEFYENKFIKIKESMDQKIINR